MDKYFVECACGDPTCGGNCEREEAASVDESKPYPVPCNDCGAAVGQPCMDGCPTYDV